MVKLRVAARVIPEDDYLRSLERPSHLPIKGEKRLLVVVREPHRWQIGTLALEVQRSYKSCYQRYVPSSFRNIEDDMSDPRSVTCRRSSTSKTTRTTAILIHNSSFPTSCLMKAKRKGMETINALQSKSSLSRAELSVKAQLPSEPNSATRSFKFNTLRPPDRPCLHSLVSPPRLASEHSKNLRTSRIRPTALRERGRSRYPRRSPKSV